MTANRYRIGDRVRITADLTGTGVREGETGAIVNVLGTEYRAIMDSGATLWVTDEHLEPETDPPRFKVGDRVEIVADNAYGSAAKEGDRGTVRTVETYHDDTHRYEVVMDGGPVYVFRRAHLRLASEPASAKTRLKVGGRVRITEKGYEYSGIRVGTTGKITEDDHSALPLYVEFDDGRAYWFHRNRGELELTEPAETDFDLLLHETDDDKETEFGKIARGEW